MPAWVRKIVEHAATVLITAMGMAIVSCANTGDLGAIAGGLLGGGADGAAVEGGLTADDLQESLEGAGLVCATDEDLAELEQRIDTFQQMASDCRGEAELLRRVVRGKVADVVEVPDGVTAIGNLVDLLAAAHAQAVAERDAVLRTLNGVRALMGAPELTIEAVMELQEDSQ